MKVWCEQDAIERKQRNAEYEKQLSEFEDATMFRPRYPKGHKIIETVPETKKQRLKRLVNWNRNKNAIIKVFREKFRDYDLDGNRLFTPVITRGPRADVCGMMEGSWDGDGNGDTDGVERTRANVCGILERPGWGWEWGWGWRPHVSAMYSFNVVPMWLMMSGLSYIHRHIKYQTDIVSICTTM